MSNRPSLYEIVSQGNRCSVELSYLNDRREDLEKQRAKLTSNELKTYNDSVEYYNKDMDKCNKDLDEWNKKFKEYYPNAYYKFVKSKDIINSLNQEEKEKLLTDILIKGDRIMLKYFQHWTKMSDEQIDDFMEENNISPDAIQKRIYPIENRIDALSRSIQLEYDVEALYTILTLNNGYCIPYVIHIRVTVTSEETKCEIVKTDEFKCRNNNQCVQVLTTIHYTEEDYESHHIAIILIDKLTKKIEYYEPLGKADTNYISCENHIKKWLNDMYPSYEYSIGDKKGLQCSTSESSCFIITLLYFYLKVIHKENIANTLYHLYSQGDPYIKRLVYTFAHKIEKLAKENNLHYYSKL